MIIMFYFISQFNFYFSVYSRNYFYLFEQYRKKKKVKKLTNGNLVSLLSQTKEFKTYLVKLNLIGGKVKISPPFLLIINSHSKLHIKLSNKILLSSKYFYFYIHTCHIISPTTLHCYTEQIIYEAF